jgi:hypothetical protein
MRLRYTHEPGLHAPVHRSMAHGSRVKRVEITIKGQDLIPAVAYFQSNLIVVVGARVDGPQCPTGWRGHGVAGAHQSSVLHGYGAPFSVVSLPMEPVGCEELTKGAFYWQGAPKQDVRWQGSSFNLRRWWGGALQGSAHDKVGQNGCGA